MAGDLAQRQRLIKVLIDKINAFLIIASSRSELSARRVGFPAETTASSSR
ncbi:Uncharacterised protein [Klebsiella michiganensis]|nr:Uncharacterised protein [Klebsiella michiganensis]